jgi:hypothetical protein
MHTHQLQIVDTDGDTVSFSFGQSDKQVEVVSMCEDINQSVVTYIGHKEIKALQAFLDNFNSHMYRLGQPDGDY